MLKIVTFEEWFQTFVSDCNGREFETLLKLGKETLDDNRGNIASQTFFLLTAHFLSL